MKNFKMCAVLLLIIMWLSNPSSQLHTEKMQESFGNELTVEYNNAFIFSIGEADLGDVTKRSYGIFGNIWVN